MLIKTPTTCTGQVVFELWHQHSLVSLLPFALFLRLANTITNLSLSRKTSQGDESWPAVSFSASDGKRSKKMYVITYKTAIRWIFRSVFASLTIFSINSLRIHILTRDSKLPAFTIDFVVLRTAGSSNTF